MSHVVQLLTTATKAQILENHIAEKRTQKTAWFEQLGGSWHLRVDSEHPWGRGLVKSSDHIDQYNFGIARSHFML